MSKINIKGHVKIELSDGQKVTKRIEGDNMVTKALAYFYKQGGISNPSAFGASAVRDNPLHYLLGGIMCLDTALDEDDEIIRVPAGVQMTANGARDVVNTGNPPELGSYNALESGWQNDGSFKMVFDWTTSQGNGTVACVCLSSLYGGYKGIGNRTSLLNKEMNTNMGVYNSISSFNNQDLDNAYEYLGQYNNKAFFLKRLADSGYSTASEWQIITASSPKEKIDVRNSLRRRQLDIKTVTHQHDLSAYGNGTYRVVQVGKYAYLMVAYAHTSGSYYTRHFHFDNDHPVYIYKIDLETVSIVDTIALSPATTGAAAFEMDGGVYPTISANGKWAIYHNLLFDLSNLTNVTEIDNFNEDTGMTFISEDIAESGSQRLDATAGEMLPTNYNGNNNYVAVGMDNLIGIADSFFRDPRYIATIFNLDSPVTKDASKTMKVTYILRFS